MPNPTENCDKVQVEISSELLSSLLNSGLLHCGDCICLNAGAKSVLWHTLLQNSTSYDENNISKPNGGSMLCA